MARSHHNPDAPAIHLSVSQLARSIYVLSYGDDDDEAPHRDELLQEIENWVSVADLDDTITIGQLAEEWSADKAAAAKMAERHSVEDGEENVG